MVNGREIREHPFNRPPIVSTSTSHSYEQQMARLFMKMDYAEYMALPGTRRWIDLEAPSLCKCDVVALYRLHMLIEAVGADAQHK